VVLLFWDILELMSFLHHDARSLPNRQGPINLMPSKVEASILASNLFPHPTRTPIISIMYIQNNSIHGRVGTYVQRLLLVEKQRIVIRWVYITKIMVYGVSL
jgi:hypothetical protein